MRYLNTYYFAHRCGYSDAGEMLRLVRTRKAKMLRGSEAVLLDACMAISGGSCDGILCPCSDRRQCDEMMSVRTAKIAATALDVAGRVK